MRFAGASARGQITASPPKSAATATAHHRGGAPRHQGSSATMMNTTVNTRPNDRLEGPTISSSRGDPWMLMPSRRILYSRARRTRQHTRSGALREHGRDDHRVLRLLYLCDRGGARVPAALFSRVGSDVGNAQFTCHFRNRFPGAPDRFGALRALRRSHRPEDHFGGGAADDGRFDGGDRAAADVRTHRCGGAGAAGAVPLRSGIGARGEWGGAVLLAVENAPP